MGNTGHVWQPEANWQEPVLSFHHVTFRIESRLSGLVANAFIC